MDTVFLQKILFNNSLYNYLVSLIIIIASIFIIKFIKYFLFDNIYKALKKFSLSFGELFNKSLSRRMSFLTYLIIIYIAINRLVLNRIIERTVNIFFILGLVVYITLIVQDVVIYTAKKYWEKKTSKKAQETVLIVSFFIIKVVTWLIALLFLLDNLNIEIRGLITGLGVGGIAIAFAAQTILSDIFSYFTIFLDRPFDIGDFIIIGDYRGTVEHIGIKTTRIRSLSGEQLVFSNNDLTNSRIKNYKRMQRRRINFNFGVTYDTPVEKAEMIPNIVESIITDIENAIFDRAHFASYGEFSLVYHVVYYVKDSDYKVYMDLQEEINLKLKERFQEEGIEFAYPTQSVHVYDRGAYNNEIEPVKKRKKGDNNE